MKLMTKSRFQNHALSSPRENVERCTTTNASPLTIAGNGPMNTTIVFSYSELTLTARTLCALFTGATIFNRLLFVDLQPHEITPVSRRPTCPALFGDKHGTWIRALQSSQAVNVTSNEFHVREEDLNISEALLMLHTRQQLKRKGRDENNSDVVSIVSSQPWPMPNGQARKAQRATEASVVKIDEGPLIIIPSLRQDESCICIPAPLSFTRSLSLSLFLIRSSYLSPSCLPFSLFLFLPSGVIPGRLFCGESKFKLRERIVLVDDDTLIVSFLYSTAIVFFHPTESNLLGNLCACGTRKQTLFSFRKCQSFNISFLFFKILYNLKKYIPDRINIGNAKVKFKKQYALIGIALLERKSRETFAGATICLSPQEKGRYILEYVCKQLNILEMDYFGLRYVDKERFLHWLDLAKTAIKQVKDMHEILLCFRVKFYPPDPLRLKEEITRYQVYQQLKRDLLYGRLCCSPGEAALLVACIVQSELGDYDPEIHEGNYISEHKLLKTQTPTIEDKAMDLHQTQLKGFTPEQAENYFLRIASQLDTYAVDPHPVKDPDKGTQLHLGINHCGILTFQDSRKIQHFRWSEVQKINFEGKMFIVHVTINEKKHLVGFKCPTATNCRHVWRCAIEQMLFFTIWNITSARHINALINERCPMVVRSTALIIKSSKAPASANGRIPVRSVHSAHDGKTRVEVSEIDDGVGRETTTKTANGCANLAARPGLSNGFDHSGQRQAAVGQHEGEANDYYFRDSFDHSSSESQLLDASGKPHSRSVTPTDTTLFNSLRKTPEMVALRSQYYVPIKEFLRTKLGLF
ncbi:FERM domain-containing protein 3 [Trachymyrmex zeteki]|uniref:FERM domain-containing protein 3 n=1 Tax=Mycetomoellerius zeteki TaxID=64791 RepID=A0A151WMG6_9HYME|nr:FERM domain-containing protein 3 [Trachymyrmex zeteki]